MKPKKQAKEIFDKMYSFSDELNKYPMCRDTAKQCALFAVETIINSNPQSPITHRTFKTSGGHDMVMTEYPPFMYWNDVYLEIEKL